MKYVLCTLSRKMGRGDSEYHKLTISNRKLFYKNINFSLDSIIELCIKPDGGVVINSNEFSYDESFYNRNGMMLGTVFLDKENEILYVFILNRFTNGRNYVLQIDGDKPDLFLDIPIINNINWKTGLESIRESFKDYIKAYGDVELPFAANKPNYLNHELTYCHGRGTLKLEIKDFLKKYTCNYVIDSNLEYETHNKVTSFNIKERGYIHIVPRRNKRIFLFGESIDVSLGHFHIHVI